ESAHSLGIQLQLAPADSPEDITGAFATMKERADAFIVMPSPMLFGEHQRIVQLAAQNGLPGMYQAREFVDAGGLISYGANLDDLFRQAATYLDKILKGTKPLEGAGIALAEQYRDQGLYMLPDHAQFEDGSVSVEAGLMMMLDRMRTGKLRVFKEHLDWWEEFRLYHRKDGKVVKEGDDLLCAT